MNGNDILLFFGDSITDGNRGRSMDCNHIMGHGYQSIIASKLALDNYRSMPKFINKGYSGFCVGDLYEKLESDVIVNKPTVLSVLVGVNDVHKYYDLPLGKTTNNYITVYKKMIKEVRNALPGIKMIICEPFYLEAKNQSDPFGNTPHCLCERPVVPGNSDITDERVCRIKAEMNMMQKELKAFAEAEGCLFVPLQDKFNEYTSCTDGSYFIWDNIHPTVAGHELIAREWLKVAGENL